MIIYYIRKTKGSRIQGISILISWYMSNLKEKTFLVCQPGYLSSTLSQTKKKSLEIEKIISLFKGPSKSILRGVFSHSMNFNEDLEFYNRLKKQYLFLDQVYLETHSTNKSNLQKIKNNLRDHSKCIWFYKDDYGKNDSVFNGDLEALKSILEIDNTSYLFESSKLKALAVGSTNLSATSYFKVPTDKGETDVFFISEEGLKEVTGGQLTTKEMAFKFLDDAIKDYAGPKEDVYKELRKSIMVAETISDEKDNTIFANVFGDLEIYLDTSYL